MAAIKELIPNISLRSEDTHLDYFDVESGKGTWYKTRPVKVFYIPINKTVRFIFKVTKAQNMESTAVRVFLALQDLNNFGEPQWLPINGKTSDEPLHTYINRISEKQIADGSFNKLTDSMTKGVGINYLRCFDIDKSGLASPTPIELELKAEHIGKAFWLEAFNFVPEWGDSKSSRPEELKPQGFIIVGIDSIQILHFYAEKRTKEEKEIKSVKQKTNTAIKEPLAYGDIIDLHISIHTQAREFPIELTIIEDDTQEIVYETSLNESNFKNTPKSFQNIYTIQEINLKPSWISQIAHEPNNEPDKGIRNFTIKLRIAPLQFIDTNRAAEVYEEQNKEIKFAIHYKDEWSINEEEQEWVAQVAQIHEATLVFQGIEECGFSAIKISDGTEGSPHYLLKQEEDGSLATDKKTELLEYVAGNKNNIHTITIDLEEVKTEECQEAGFDNATARAKSHKNNTFIVPDFDTNTDIEPVVLAPETSTVKWSKALGLDQNRFDNAPIFKEVGKRTQEQLKFKLAYPYNALNEHTFLLKYLTFQIDPVYLPVVIQSCRYIRTPVFKVYPDAVFAYHYMYDPEQELWFNNKPVDLPELKGDVLSYIKDIVDWVYTPLKPILKKVGVDKEVLQLIENYIKSPSPNQKTGFHMLADGEEINYAQIQPYKAFFYYQMLQIALLPLAIEILLIWLTRGKNLQTKLGKLAKRAKNVRDDLKQFGNDYNIELIYPKLCVNYGMYRQQEEKGNVSTVLECTMQAKPLLGLKTTQEFKFKFPGGKVTLEAIFKGKIEMDVNIAYNTYTKKFTLNKNAKAQTGQSGVPYTEGDIIKADRYISCNIEIDAEYKTEGSFELLWIDVPYSAKIDAEFNINGAIGTETRFGYGAEYGLYYQNIYYFTGAKGQYKAEAKATVGWWNIFNYKSGNNKDKAEWIDVQVLEPFTWAEPRTYIVKTVKDLANAFNKTQPNETFKPQAPPAPTVDFSNNTSNTNK